MSGTSADDGAWSPPGAVGKPRPAAFDDERTRATTPAPPSAVHAALASGALRAAAWLGRRPWWMQVVLLFAASRLVSFLIFSAGALQQGTNPWFAPQPDYFRFLQIWDSEWYGRIVQHGYPSVLPRSPSGTVTENAWAFYPVFPFLVRFLSAATTIPWQIVAQAVALLAGFGAAMVVYRLFRHFAGHGTSMWGVAFFAFFPISAILQVPYAESLGTLFLAWAFLWIVERRYLAAIPVVAFACLTRPVGVPLAVALAALFLIRWIRREALGVSLGELARLALLTAATAASAIAWPAIAWAATGVVTAYTDTEAVWRGSDLVPFMPWFDTGHFLFGPVLGTVAPFVLVAVVALYLTSAHVRLIGVELRLWCAAYALYLLAFLYPQSSTFRMMLPFFPLALAGAALSRSRAYRGTALATFVILQIVWVVWLWDWAQLPGGGDWPP
ncbi:hypothetical protein SPF06_00525 [Sinomonas sp. JGH33]|uniref:Integral membrane protein n=1 Tax=Sinomonas terricola TaxID=3110330 RepID=A0ABU5T0K5_9MICC|nr:hypothetical protein [Sinomonas sp. JGH33]MEA5453193.1 hypothetical protein [Sinomonas sp. JGH33]